MRSHAPGGTVINDETRFIMLARQHDAASRSLKTEAETHTRPYLRQQAEQASRILQQLANAYVITAEEVRRENNTRK